MNEGTREGTLAFLEVLSLYYSVNIILLMGIIRMDWIETPWVIILLTIGYDKNSSVVDPTLTYNTLFQN